MNHEDRDWNVLGCKDEESLGFSAGHKGYPWSPLLGDYS